MIDAVEMETHHDRVVSITTSSPCEHMTCNLSIADLIVLEARLRSPLWLPIEP